MNRVYHMRHEKKTVQSMCYVVIHQISCFLEKNVDLGQIAKSNLPIIYQLRSHIREPHHYLLLLVCCLYNPQFRLRKTSRQEQKTMAFMLNLPLPFWASKEDQCFYSIILWLGSQTQYNT